MGKGMISAEEITMKSKQKGTLNPLSFSQIKCTKVMSAKKPDPLVRYNLLLSRHN